MKITELKSENFKRLTAHVTMNGKSVIVQGANGTGKSSFIDAVWIALTGKDVPAEPIQQGHDSAKISVTVQADDGSSFVVERKFTPSGGTLTVKTLDGAKFPTPQKFLDAKIGRISFDPFEFINKPPREQKKFLMDLLGIDLNSIDQTKKELLAERDALRKGYHALSEEINKLPPIVVGLQEKSAGDVIQRFNEINNQREEIRQDAIAYRHANENILSLTKEIEELEIKVESALDRRESWCKRRDEFGENPTFDLPETGDLEAELKAIEEHNQKFRQQQETSQKLAKLKELQAKGQAVSERLTAIEAQRTDVITNAKMPIAGLSFSEDGLLFDNLPFTEEQLSTSKLIEVGIKISMALNPALRIMQIKDGSLLDSDTLAVIQQAAKDKDYQLFIERVSDSKEIGFIIEE